MGSFRYGVWVGLFAGVAMAVLWDRAQKRDASATDAEWSSPATALIEPEGGSETMPSERPASIVGE